MSLLGTAMTRFALMVWGWEETGRATTLALLLRCQIGATLLLSPLAGVLVDRFGRRRVTIAADLAAGLPTIALLVLHLGGRLELWQVYAAAALAGAAETFQLPSRASLRGTLRIIDASTFDGDTLRVPSRSLNTEIPQ